MSLSVFELSRLADFAYQDPKTAIAPDGWTVETYVSKAGEPDIIINGKPISFLGTDVGNIKAQDLVETGDYQGYLLHNASTGEWVLADRGTVFSFGNIVRTDGSIALTKLGVSVDTAYEKAAGAFATYAAQNFIIPATQNGNVTGIYETGHSLGFAGAQQQHAVLTDISELAGIPIQAVGFNGAGVASSNLAEGHFGASVINFGVPGDRVDNAGKLLGIKIELDGAGAGKGMPLDFFRRSPHLAHLIRKPIVK